MLDGGAYGSYGIASTFYTAVLQPVTYHLPRYAFDACRVFTNKPPCGPKRGHGTVQPRFGQEVQLDKIAHKLELGSGRTQARDYRTARYPDRQLFTHQHNWLARVHRKSRRAFGLEEQIPQAAVRARV